MVGNSEQLITGTVQNIATLYGTEVYQVKDWTGEDHPEVDPYAIKAHDGTGLVAIGAVVTFAPRQRESSPKLQD